MIQALSSTPTGAPAPMQIAIDLSAEENWLFFSQYAPGAHCGVRTPFARPGSAFEKASQAAFQSLSERHLIAKAGERLLFDPWLETIGDVCAHPEYSIIMQISRQGGDLMHRCLHFRYGWIVEYTACEQGYRLTAFCSRVALAEHIEKLWALPRLRTPGEGEGCLDEAEFRQARDACLSGDLDCAVAILVGAGLPATIAQRFGSVLAAPLVNASAVCVSGRPGHTLSMLAGAEGIWLLEPCQKGEELKIKILPTNASQVRKRITRLLQYATKM